MSRINTNVSSLLAQRILGQNNQSLTKSLERLSTGLAINRGADNPAGLIASENLRSEIKSITAAIGNAERADQVVNIAEGGLQEVSSLLLELQGLITSTANDAGLSVEERDANQLQVDSILQTIDRIANTTNFQGSKLLNGTFDFNVTGQHANVSDFTVNAAKLEFGDTRNVQVTVTGSAQHAGLFLSAGGTDINLSAGGNRLTLEVAGNDGSREFSFASGTTLTDAVTQINTFKSVTGVSATVNGTGIVLKSDEFGSSKFVSVKVISDGGINDVASGAGAAAGVYTLSAVNENAVVSTGGTAFSSATNPIRDIGQDVSAIINAVNATADGTTARINNDFLDLSIDLSTTGSQTLTTFDAFTITGGGAKFILGPDVDISNQVSVGIGNVAARKLGTQALGFLDDLASGGTRNLVDGNLEEGQAIVDRAINEVSSLRGRLGAFQKNVIGATIRALGVSFENTSAAESTIRDTDFAAETAQLTRSQILVNASTQALGIANSNPQSVLSLLG
jgi:flagellin